VKKMADLIQEWLNDDATRLSARGIGLDANTDGLFIRFGTSASPSKRQLLVMT
jgi:hypothetical protein